MALLAFGIKAKFLLLFKYFLYLFLVLILICQVYQYVIGVAHTKVVNEML